MDSPFRISVVLFQEGEWWSAQCLEHDIATQARSLPELYEELRRTLSAHAAVCLAEGKQPFAELGPAPQRFWRMFEATRRPS